MSKTPMEKCDLAIYHAGKEVCVFHAEAWICQAFAVELTHVLGYKVDWHYVGGRACFLTLGDVKEAREAAKDLMRDFAMMAGVPTLEEVTR